jgi:hypothetical protein
LIIEDSLADRASSRQILDCWTDAFAAPSLKRKAQPISGLCSDAFQNPFLETENIEHAASCMKKVTRAARTSKE